LEPCDSAREANLEAAKRLDREVPDQLDPQVLGIQTAIDGHGNVPIVLYLPEIGRGYKSLQHIAKSINLDIVARQANINATVQKGREPNCISGLGL
jgi:hypothetical protein